VGYILVDGIMVKAKRDNGVRLFLTAGFAQRVLAQIGGGFGPSIAAVLGVKYILVGGIMVKAKRDDGVRVFLTAGFAQRVFGQIGGGFGPSIVVILAVADGACEVSVIEHRVTEFADDGCDVPLWFGVGKMVFYGSGP
jgi:hypothetical protein